MKHTIRNPWYLKGEPYYKRFFEYTNDPIFSYRGVDVYVNYAGSWDYVLGDTAITQRAGFKKDSASSIIDEILDGKTLVSDKVAEHIKAHGFNPLSYTLYNIEYDAGRMA